MRAECSFGVLDECDDWIVVDKPAPLAVHPANGRTDEPTLLGGLQALLACDLADGSKLSILTRLDRETSGLVLVAKNRDAARHFSRQFEARRVLKQYLALVHGWPDLDRWREEGPILRAGEVEESAVWLRQKVDPSGRPCSTVFEVEGRVAIDGRHFAMVRCFPKTGRTHQIRVHLEAAGHPIVGDKIYGTDGRPYLEQIGPGLSKESVELLMLPRHALHASRLSVEWNGDDLVWDSPLPPDLARFIDTGSLIQGHGESAGN
ncbi:RNA pseudouridine synthase [Haloferula helveola]|uniref:RNA pseudouridine synthase n=1 Tax=Haloferula helveola TaxID=490095 RepID=A0ABM7RFM6_9BACT|nr:RNA pseudouridine synthase [Haloferula helveola]